MTKQDIKTAAVATLGALALSATCVGAAIGPAHAAGIASSPAAWQQAVGAELAARRDIAAPGVPAGEVARPVIALQFDAAGRFAGATLDRSSGLAAVDDEALFVANHTRFPALPAAWRGAPRTVALQLTVGAAEDMASRRTPSGQVTVATRADAFRVASR